MQQALFNHIDEPVAGIDEAGRGPLAGPVVAAAVILHPKQSTELYRDSKTLSASKRECAARTIRNDSIAWSVAWADRAEIDALNILHATMLAMRRAIQGLAIAPRIVKVDGNRLPNLQFDDRSIDGVAIVGGDAKVAAISAASILAKTTRDSIMVEMDRVYPNYGFAQHKGYGTQMHRQRLAAHGPCVEHRRSFKPVKAVA